MMARCGCKCHTGQCPGCVCGHQVSALRGSVEVAILNLGEWAEQGRDAVSLAAVMLEIGADLTAAVEKDEATP